jgi:hypothetical protein
VPPAPQASQSAKKLYAVEPGSGPGLCSATWIIFSTLSNGTVRHHAA